MSDEKNKKELPSCLKFGFCYCERLRSKLDTIGCDWMTPKVQKDWFLAGLVFDLLHGLADDEQRYDYWLFVRLGYMLIDLVSAVNFELNNCNNDKEK